MARTSLADVRTLPDAFQQYNWDLIIPTMPGTPNSKPFTFKAMTTSIPGSLLEKVPVNFHGVEVGYAGRENYSHSLAITLLETADIGTRDMIRRWQKVARNNRSNTGSFKDTYATTVELVLYDDLPTERKRIRLIGCFPESLDDASLDGGSSGIVQVSCTLHYDEIDELL